MARKGVKKQFWLTKEQALDLQRKAETVGLSEVTLIRMLVSAYEPPAAPPPSFYEDMTRLLTAAERLADTARSLLTGERTQMVDKEARRILLDEAEALRDLRLRCMCRYLSGERIRVKWQ